MKYILECSKEQAELLRDALELWARVCIGQFDQATDPFTHLQLEDSSLKGTLRNLRDEWRRNIQVPGRGSDLTWEMFQVIRHRLAWDRMGNPPTRNSEMWAVDFDEPLKVTPTPLLKIQKVEDDV